MTLRERQARGLGERRLFKGLLKSTLKRRSAACIPSRTRLLPIAGPSEEADPPPHPPLISCHPPPPRQNPSHLIALASRTRSVRPRPPRLSGLLRLIDISVGTSRGEIRGMTHGWSRRSPTSTVTPQPKFAPSPALAGLDPRSVEDAGTL